MEEKVPGGRGSSKRKRKSQVEEEIAAPMLGVLSEYLIFTTFYIKIILNESRISEPKPI